MKKIIGIVFALLLIASCRNKEQLGPTLKVNILTPLAVNIPTVDFAAGDKIFFTASFANSASWLITITGSNGSKKTISGVSREINAENSTWTGTSDILPSFMAETVTAVLTFQVDPQTNSVPITISAKRVSDLATDALVTNFVVNKRHYDSGEPFHYKIGWTAPYGWPSDYPNIDNTDITYPKPDGDNYLIMSGIPWDNGAGVTPYVNNLLIMADSSDVQYGKYFPLSADPSKVYFNIMLYGTNTPYTWLQVNVFEEGPTGEPLTRVINYKQVGWTGWKLFSYKYSDLALGSTTVPNPQKITGVQLILLSTSPTLPGPSVKIGIDHITFTNKAPYQP